MPTLPDPAPGLWVQSDVATDGSYVIALHAGHDRAWVLTPEQATAHAAAFVAAATTAEHETAVVELMRRSGIDLPSIGQVLCDELRPRRPFDFTAVAPLRLIAVAGSRGPLIEIHLDDQPLGQLSPDGCRSHATGVLQVLAAAALDQVLHQVLTTTLDLPDASARAFIDNLPTTWPGAQTTP